MNHVANYTEDYSHFSPAAKPEHCSVCGSLSYDLDMDGHCEDCEMVNCIGCGDDVPIKVAKYYLGECICDDCATYSVMQEDRSPRLISLAHIEKENDLKKKCAEALQNLKNELPNTINLIKENCKPLNN